MVTREIETQELDRIVGPPSRMTRLRRRVHGYAMLAAFKAREWRVHRSIPGIAGIVLVSASVGGIFGGWYGVGMAGLFLLRIDNRL